MSDTAIVVARTSSPKGTNASSSSAGLIRAAETSWTPSEVSMRTWNCLLEFCFINPLLLGFSFNLSRKNPNAFTATGCCFLATGSYMQVSPDHRI